MNFAVRDGKFDVVIAAGPRIETWPSAGVRRISMLCAEMGLSVGLFGGESLNVRGVIPHPGTGGIVIIEDIQKRIHRIHARAIVRVTPEFTLPNPFPGWQSAGLIPISTAEKLRNDTQILWNSTIAILGTGNRALRFGSGLLETGTPEVYCIEMEAQWGAKRYAGWEVEKRRFEMLGGRIIEAKPLQLISKEALLWQLRLQDSQGIRVLDIGRVVSAGPFRQSSGFRSHPPESFLFELEQTAPNSQNQNFEGWVMEEERGNWLAAKIVRALVQNLGSQRESVDRIFRHARGRLKRYLNHRETPFAPSYQGKWIELADSKNIRSFSGVPQQLHHTRPIASVECFEEIPCNICQEVCPTSAIQIGKVPRIKSPILNESACISCGKCVVACPSGSIPMLYENENQFNAQLSLPWRGSKPWKPGEQAILINRRGETLGSGRVIEVTDQENQEFKNEKLQLVKVEVPSHLIWEARSLKKARTPETADEAFLSSVTRSSSEPEKVEITLNGEKRFVRDKISISIALFEMGKSRSSDILLCQDGSCGLCMISVDSINKLACQTKIHKGMAIKIPDQPQSQGEQDSLCPCLGITEETVIERLHHGKLQSLEAVVSVTQVGEGKCHGQLCMGALRRILQDQGLDVSQWIDWRFPWSDWLFTHS